MDLNRLLELNNSYQKSHDTVISLIQGILDKGEVTGSEMTDVETSLGDCDEDYNQVIQAEKNFIKYDLQLQINELKRTKLDINADSIIDLLTNGGRISALHTDGEGNIIMDVAKLKDLDQVKLVVDEQGKSIQGIIADTEVEQTDGSKVKLKVAFSTMNQKVDNITTTVGQIEGVANKADSTAQGALTKASQIEQKVDSITSTVKRVEGTVTDANKKSDQAITEASQIKQTVEGITSTVQRIEGVADSANGKADNAVTKVSQIEQTVDGIKSTVLDTNVKVDGSIKETYNEFYLSNSNTSVIGGSWDTVAPNPQDGKYIWLRDVYVTNTGDKTYGNPICITGASGGQGAPGPQGVGIKQVQILYYIHYSKTTAPSTSATGWTSSIPDYQAGKYLWQVNKITYTNDAVAFTTPVYISSWEANHKAETAISVANQTSEKFEWIVQKGSTQSSLTLTDATIEAIAKSNIKLKAKNISLEGLITANGSFRILEDGRAEIDSLSVDKEISTDILTFNTINNSRYQPVLDEDVTITIDNTSTSSDEFENGSIYTTISDFQEACPVNLNGHTVTLIFASNYEGNLHFATQNNGKIVLNFNNHTIKGYLYFGIKTMEYEFADNNNGIIMPNRARVGDNGNYSVFVYNTSLKIQDVTIYAGNGSGNNSGIEFSSFAQGKIDNVSFVNCYNAVRAYVQSKVHCASSNGTTSSYAFYSSSGSDISLGGTTQVSRSSGTNHYTTGSNGVIRAEGATFNGTKITGTNTNTNTSTETKTATLTADYGDTYRKTVYNNWKKDGTVRQGDYGYGDCVGCWFFGNKLSNYANKNISKIVITFTRQSGGSYGEVLHGVKTHNYTSRPSGTPSFRSDFSKSVSVGVGSTGTITLTSSTDIANFMRAKGVGLVPASQDKAHYSVCSGTCKIKITYTE